MIINWSFNCQEYFLIKNFFSYVHKVRKIFYMLEKFSKIMTIYVNAL
jgi:hypothetical protein